MTKNIFKFIVKWEGGKKTGNAILFLPEVSANRGRIVCYAHMGQHAEADISYYRGLRNPDKRAAKVQEEVTRLIREYQGFMDSGETLKRVYRDNRLLRKERE